MPRRLSKARTTVLLHRRHATVRRPARDRSSSRVRAASLGARPSPCRRPRSSTSTGINVGQRIVPGFTTTPAGRPRHRLDQRRRGQQPVKPRPVAGSSTREVRTDHGNIDGSGQTLMVDKWCLTVTVPQSTRTVRRGSAARLRSVDRRRPRVRSPRACWTRDQRPQPVIAESGPPGPALYGAVAARRSGWLIAPPWHEPIDQRLNPVSDQPVLPHRPHRNGIRRQPG